MFRYFSFAFSLFCISEALPTLTSIARPEPRAAQSSATLSGINELIGGILNNGQDEVEDVTSALHALLQELDQVVPTAAPTSVADVATILNKIAGADPEDLVESIATLVLNSLGPNSLEGVFREFSAGSNSASNVNPREPLAPIYPSVTTDDASYSIDEATLRAAIYIPDSFTYGKKPPVILVPGTGLKGGLNFEPNLGKLLPNEDYADPLWLNIPGWQLENVPWNSEFVAYAINYIAGITAQRVNVVAFSQGNLNTQWALTYWSSTRENVEDYVAVSPDYHGSILIDVLCPALTKGIYPCAPSLWQQKYNANFIEAFRAAGGASAWVPTTTLYTGTDDFVQPQHGTNASAFLADERNVGVTNIELQLNCPLDSPALVGTHESLLWGQPLQALIKDALTHDGPASIERIASWNSACSSLAAEGLGLPDVVGTTATVPIAFAAEFLYSKKVVDEPPLPAYAT